MIDEIELVDSNLSGELASGGQAVEVLIYRLVNEARWTLEVCDEYGNSTVWDETFASDSEALFEARKAVLKETISAFIGPQDGESNGKWR